MQILGLVVAFALLSLSGALDLIKKGIDLMPSTCVTDSNCRSHEFCDHDFPNPFGKCAKGKSEGEMCMFDRHCASKRCSYFRCEKRVQLKDGPCKISADCPDDQFCDDIEGSDDLRKCYDRKCFGTCRKDSQCLSDRCHLFTCIKPSNITC